jgi:hypothetical protein
MQVVKIQAWALQPLHCPSGSSQRLEAKLKNIREKGTNMATTLEDLEKRLTALEQEVTSLRQLVERRPIDETPAERGARLLREGKRSQAALAAGWAKAMEQMGIRGEPVGAERLQEMMLASGIKPEENAFSRGIIEMREE